MADDSYKIKAICAQESILCPHCFGIARKNWHFSIDELLHKKKIETEDGDEDILESPVSFPPSLEVADWRGKIYCPDCKRRIPLEYVQRPTIMIQIAGIPGSGKSHLLAAMTKRFANDAHHFGLTFREISDPTESKAEKINYDLIDMQKRLFTGEVLDPTLSLGASKSLQEIQIEQNGRLRTYHFPRAFLFVMDKISKDQKSSPKDSLWNLTSHPQKKERSSGKESEVGYNICFSDLAGEYFTRSFEAGKDQAQRAVSYERRINILIFDLFQAPRLVERYNEWFHQNRQPLIGEDKNDVIFDYVVDWKKHPLIVLVTKFDEWKKNFLEWLEKEKKDKKADAKKFGELFRPDQIDLDDKILEEYSKYIKEFLTPASGGNEDASDIYQFMTHIDEYNKCNRKRKVLFIPVSATNCPQNEQEGKFEKCEPVWTNLPMKQIWKLIQSEGF